jgi:hypothetical protein
VRHIADGVPFSERRMATLQDMSISKISRQILILPIILSVGFPIGFTFALTPVGYQFLGEAGASDDLFFNAVFFYAFCGLFSLIPYWLLAWHAKESMRKDEFNIYYIRGIVAGLSPVTFAWWLLVGAFAADVPRDAKGAAFALGALQAVAMLVGLATGSFGWLMGFGYGVLKRQSHDPNLRWHPKNLWW